MRSIRWCRNPECLVDLPDRWDSHLCSCCQATLSTPRQQEYLPEYGPVVLRHRPKWVHTKSDGITSGKSAGGDDRERSPSFLSQKTLKNLLSWRYSQKYYEDRDEEELSVLVTEDPTM